MVWWLKVLAALASDPEFSSQPSVTVYNSSSAVLDTLSQTPHFHMHEHIVT